MTNPLTLTLNNIRHDVEPGRYLVIFNGKVFKSVIMVTEVEFDIIHDSAVTIFTYCYSTLREYLGIYLRVLYRRIIVWTLARVVMPTVRWWSSVLERMK